MPRRTVRTWIPPDGVFRVDLVVRAEGEKSKGGLRASVPAPVVRGLKHLQWNGKHLWVRREDHAMPFVAFVRPHPTVTTFGLPKWWRDDRWEVGDTIHLALRDAGPFRCRSTKSPAPVTASPISQKPKAETDPDRFSSSASDLDLRQGGAAASGLSKAVQVDWAQFVPSSAFPTEEGETLVVYTRYSPPLRLPRYTTIEEGGALTLPRKGVWREMILAFRELVEDAHFAQLAAEVLERDEPSTSLEQVSGDEKI